MIGNDDPSVQEKSAHALRNMRQLLDENKHVERTLINEITRGSIDRLNNIGEIYGKYV